MKKILCICLLAFCFLNDTQAQSFIRGISKSVSNNEFIEKENTQKNHKKTSPQNTDNKSRSKAHISTIIGQTNTYNKISEVKLSNDYVLYRNVVRRYTWL